MELDLRAGEEPGRIVLPFLFDLNADSRGWTMVVHNGAERITVTDIALSNDTINIRMPLFDSEFKGRVLNDSTLRGYWYNYLKGRDYRIPFVAHAGRSERFPEHPDTTARITGNWEVHFSQGVPDDAYDALGMFHAHEGFVSGTFCTETGDYRYLEGVVHNDSLLLSSFDGSHAFLFKAQVQGDSMAGRYWSGSHWQEPWVAHRNTDFHLRNADSLTFLKEGYDMVDFRFPSIDGGTVSPMDSAYLGKVIMVQVMGSWCPNCVDETLLLDEMYGKYHDQGLEVIAVAFEKQKDSTLAVQALKDFRDKLNVRYRILYAGESSKEVASARLPFLDHVMSYPTCIFIDRGGKVRRIRTGFYGPGTGAHYDSYKETLTQFLEQMLAEQGDY